MNSAEQKRRKGIAERVLAELYGDNVAPVERTLFLAAISEAIAPYEAAVRESAAMLVEIRDWVPSRMLDGVPWSDVAKRRDRCIATLTALLEDE